MKSKRFISSMNIKLDPISIYLTQRICVITWMQSNLFGGRLPIKKCDNPAAKMTCMPADKQVEEISAVKSPNPKRGALRISWQTCKATTQPAARARLTPKQECKSFHYLNVSEAQSFRSGASSCSCSKKHLQRDYTKRLISVVLTFHFEAQVLACLVSTARANPGWAEECQGLTLCCLLEKGKKKKEKGCCFLGKSWSPMTKMLQRSF